MSGWCLASRILGHSLSVLQSLETWNIVLVLGVSWCLESGDVASYLAGNSWAVTTFWQPRRSLVSLTPLDIVILQKSLDLDSRGQDKECSISDPKLVSNQV